MISHTLFDPGRYTIVSGGDLEDTAGRSEGLRVRRVEGGRAMAAASDGSLSLSRSDFAWASVACLSFAPRNARVELFRATSGNPSSGATPVETEEDWGSVLS